MDEDQISCALEQAILLEHQGKWDDAITAYQSCLKKLQPATFGLKSLKLLLKLQAQAAGRLANLLSTLGNIGEAIPYYLTAQKFDPDQIQYGIDFAASVRFAKIESCAPEFKTAIATCLQNEGIFHQNLARVACDLIEDEKDPLLPLLIEKALIPNFRIENLLTALRRSSPKPSLLYALSQQCFLNEYIYQKLPNEGLNLPSSTPEEIALLGCYTPLHTLELQIPKGDVEFERLIKQQIKDPQTEKQLVKTISSLGDISDPTSQKVQQQYEENPYPRWTSANQKKPFSINYLPNISAPSIFIAGCGTGLQAVNAARFYPNSKVLALDFSLPSLAYAKRMALEQQISNLSFLQGDILDLEQLNQMFDIIECVGVLHHMQDPVKGWAALNKKLKPKGFMNIGLYSALGRRDVIEARQWISQKGWKPTPDDIRTCRQEMMKLPDDSFMKRVTRSLDFFSMSTCRDLLFHAHELYFTIPQIGEILKDLGLKFLGFDLPIPLRPKETLTTLSDWDRYEKNYPDTFIGMYQFWVQKT